MIYSFSGVIVKIIKAVLCIIAGFSSGMLVSAGVFAYITMIGIIPRLAAKTKTSDNIRLYENGVVLGGTIANIIYIFNISYHLQGAVLIIVNGAAYTIFGIAAGIFVGCLAVSLAEVLKSFPIFTMRIRLTWGIPYIALCMAVGKMLGSFYGLMKTR